MHVGYVSRMDRYFDNCLLVPETNQFPAFILPAWAQGKQGPRIRLGRRDENFGGITGLVCQAVGGQLDVIASEGE